MLLFGCMRMYSGDKHAQKGMVKNPKVKHACENMNEEQR